MFGDKPRSLPQRIALILMPEFTMMPVTSAIEPLRLANRQAEKALYVWTMHSADSQPVAASNGLLTMANGDLEAIRRACHRAVLRRPQCPAPYGSSRLINWLRQAARRGTDIGALCTGAHVLAEAGMLDGYRCTIHWENLPGFWRGFSRSSTSPAACSKSTATASPAPAALRRST